MGKEEIPLAIIVNSINGFWDEISEEEPAIESICQIQDKVNNDYMNWLSSRVI